jgi:Flp pilus assembly protein TadG
MPSSRRHRRRRREWVRRDESGQAADAVIVFPVLLLLILAVVQFGLWYHAAAVAKAAVAEGVRTARAEGATGAEGAAATNDFLAQAGPTIVTNVHLSVSRDANVARVELRATAAHVIPGLSLPIHALAQSPVERFRSSSEGP